MGCCQMIFSCCKKNESTPLPNSTRKIRKNHRSQDSRSNNREDQNNNALQNINSASRVNRPIHNEQHNQQNDLQLLHVQRTTESFKIISVFALSNIIHSYNQLESTQKLLYNCPICLDFFNTILVSSCCGNYICRFCAENYISTVIKYMNVIRCPLCNADSNIELKDVDPTLPVIVLVK
jgi:hypothetical protein